MRNIAVVLAGGLGTRMDGDIPKQYAMLDGKPVLVHTLERLQSCEVIDGVIVTAGAQWQPQILQWKEDFSLTKLMDVAPAGRNRQISIRNGLMEAEQFMDDDQRAGVMIQDAVRPLTSVELLTRLIMELQEASGVMPALPVTDTAYISLDGRWVAGVLDRSTLFAGQAPEAFRYWPYLALYRDAPDEILSSMSGSCQLPYSQNWRVKMIPGEWDNIKITYPGDIKRCERLLQERRGRV